MEVHLIKNDLKQFRISKTQERNKGGLRELKPPLLSQVKVEKKDKF